MRYLNFTLSWIEDVVWADSLLPTHQEDLSYIKNDSYYQYEYVAVNEHNLQVRADVYPDPPREYWGNHYTEEEEAILDRRDHEEKQERIIADRLRFKEEQERISQEIAKRQELLIRAEEGPIYKHDSVPGSILNYPKEQQAILLAIKRQKDLEKLSKVVDKPRTLSYTVLTETNINGVNGNAKIQLI